VSELPVSLGQIIAAVEVASGLTRREILSDRRAPELIAARFTLFWLASKLTTLSTIRIGDATRRDPSTVWHAIQRAEEERARDPEFRAATDALFTTLLELERAGHLNLAAAVDPIATARRVLARPEREAVRVSTAEIIALCRVVVDAADQGDVPPPFEPSPNPESKDAA